MVGNTGRRLNAVEVFDPDVQAWSALPRLPERVRAAAGATAGRRFFVLGGTTAAGGGRQVFVYDVDRSRWRRGPPLPRVLYNHSAVAVGNRVYALGGYDTDGAELRDVYVLEEGRWRATSPLPRRVHAFGAVVFRGEIWVIGGRRGEEKLREVWIFDPKSRRWRAGPSLPKPMELLGAAVVGDEIHAVWEHTYQVYDAGKGRWRTARRRWWPATRCPSSTSTGRSTLSAAARQRFATPPWSKSAVSPDAPRLRAIPHTSRWGQTPLRDSDDLFHGRTCLAVAASGAKPLRGPGRGLRVTNLAHSCSRLAPGSDPNRCTEAEALEAEVLGDHHPLHLVRALADLEDLLVAVEARDRVLVHEAVAAVDLERRVRRPV